ncbi:hypothetical protein FHS85_001003 [Rhodoligotrophos appendicifer]|uniref:aspartate/glutamate racemase family protein n=1 Tax=Rhodoligotrophos appendicifer TaxID=987056 RepID=UPI001FEA10C1|nr:aspartate/glutamate racemase family protein [Rhodoligotrophos appendicifer]
MALRTVHGHSLGMLILDTHFVRIPGDVGNSATWPFPIQYRIVRGADPHRVIDGGGEGLLDGFIAAGLDLVDHGATAISTTCGFLAMFQEELAAALPVPVATTSLLQIPLIERLLPKGRGVGILTAEAAQLSARHLKAVGVEHDLPRESPPRDGAFWSMITGGDNVDRKAIEEEVLAAAQRLMTRDPQLGAIVIECANMPTYAASLAERTGLPIFDIVTMCKWLMSGLVPTVYPTSGLPQKAP